MALKRINKELADFSEQAELTPAVATRGLARRGERAPTASLFADSSLAAAGLSRALFAPRFACGGDACSKGPAIQLQCLPRRR